MGDAVLSTRFSAAVGRSGNFYFADAANDVIKEWNAAPQTFPPARTSSGDGDVYIANTFNQGIKKWDVATDGHPVRLVGCQVPTGVAVDAADKVTIADYRNNTIVKWSASTSGVIPLITLGPVGRSAWRSTAPAKSLPAVAAQSCCRCLSSFQ